MAYVNVADWKPEQVAEWLKGLDDVIFQYIHLFVAKNVNGQQLLDLQTYDLENIGVGTFGHQELILEAVGLLKNFYYDLDRENIQLLSLRLSCLANSLCNNLWKTHQNCSVVSTQILADVANVVSAVKALVCWLDRSPFCDIERYKEVNNEMLNLSVEMATSAMRDRFAENPVNTILRNCKQLAAIAEKLIQEEHNSLFLQPSSLDLATLKKRPGDHVGFIVVSSLLGALQISELKCNSAAHQCGKIEAGDEIVQINYQTVVGWEAKEVMALLFEESSTEILITLKKRPRHSKVFGQMYFTRYRLPCKKQLGSYPTKWNDLLSPPRSEIIPVPNHFRPPIRMVSRPTIEKIDDREQTNSPPSPTPSTASSSNSSSSGDELMPGPSSPNSVRLYLPKPRIPVQRRATISGASPVSKHAPLSLEQFWRELKMEQKWRSISDDKSEPKANSESELKRSPLLPHSTLNWSAQLCDKSEAMQQSEEKLLSASESAIPIKTDSAESGDSSGPVPVRQIIDSLNRVIEQTKRKPKLLPKPINLSKTASIKGDIRKSPLHMAHELEMNVRRERGKLDKSYSTPSYDYSMDSVPLSFNMKLPNSKVRSVPENFVANGSFTSPPADFIKPMETKAPPEHKIIRTDSKLERINEHEVKSTESPNLEYLKMDVYDSNVGNDKINKILDTIDSTLLFDSEPETCPNTQFESEKSSSYFSLGERKYTDNQASNSFSLARPDEKLFNYRDTVSATPCDTLRSNFSNPSQPSEKLYIHATINVPATFPRHKFERKPLSPPEPPARSAKVSPLPPKSSKNFLNNKGSIKSPPHKSPKASRKKNVWLTKRRNVTIKELGICDHEGWLCHRTRKNTRGSPQWIRCWCVIKGSIFYGFMTSEATKARLMISLPGFTVSVADEVKSRSFSFKVYHTGTTFYFAAETAEELAAWVESFTKFTMSDSDQTIVFSETESGDDEEPAVNKKDKSISEGYNLTAMKNFITGHLSRNQENKNGDKKFDSLKKNVSRKQSTKSEDQQQQQSTDNHIASLDRKYLKFFSSGGSKQNFNPVPTAQFRSYRRVPAMVEKQFGSPDGNIIQSDSLEPIPLPSASPSRPPDMADYRLASLAKCGTNNQRIPENIPPGGYITPESYLLSQQEEERIRGFHPRTLRVPQCLAPPPPTPQVSHSAAVVTTGHESQPNSPSFPIVSTRQIVNIQPIQTTSVDKNWAEPSSHNQLPCLIDTTTPSTSFISTDSRRNSLKKSALYQPPPWDSPLHRVSEESRLQPAFEMTLDRQPVIEPPLTNVPALKKKAEESGSGSSRLKNFFSSSSKSDRKTNLISSPRLKKAIFKKEKNTGHISSPSVEPVIADRNILGCINSQPALHNPEVRLPNAPDYPGLEYPPVFEPGSYSLSSLLQGSKIRVPEDNPDSKLASSGAVSPEFPDIVPTEFPESSSNCFSNDNQDNKKNPNHHWQK